MHSMRHAFILLGIMTLVVSIGAFYAFERVEVPTAPRDTIDETTTNMALTLTAPAFRDGESIPARYTCDAENISPELRIEGVPEGTQSFVLVMDDPDIPQYVKDKFSITKFDHWAVYNIPPETNVIPEGGVVGTAGLGTRGEGGYMGPCPPDREHRYFFRLYALSGTLNFIKAPTLDEVETAAQGMTLASTTLMGRYARVRN